MIELLSTEVWISLISAILGGVATKGFDFLLARRRMKKEETEGARDGVIKEYLVLLNEVKGTCKNLEAQIEIFHQKHEKCLQDNAVMSVEIYRLRAEVDDLSVNGDAVVVADSRGIVVGWPISAVKVFGWTATEAVGKPISQLIVPESYQSQYSEALSNWSKKDVPPRSQPLLLEAVNKNKEHFPIGIVLSGKKSDGQWLVIATIHKGSNRFLGEPQ